MLQLTKNMLTSILNAFRFATGLFLPGLAKNACQELIRFAKKENFNMCLQNII